MALDEQGQKIVDTLSNEDELSITIQVTEEATRTCYSIPTTTKLTDLAYWAATMIDAQNTLLKMWHQHCVDLGVPVEAFDEYVGRLLKRMQKLREDAAKPDANLGFEPPQEYKPEEDGEDDTPPEAKRREKPL